MVSMPYMFQKGQDWQLLEWYLNADDDGSGLSRIDRRVAMLELLCGDKAPKGTGDFKNDDSPNPDQAQFVLDDLVGHLQRDWFGEDTNGDPAGHDHNGAWSDGTSSPARRGWWVNWYGTPSKIFKEALCRAIEVSLDHDHGTALPDDKAFKREWPIELLWICPVGWFQAGISWREIGAQPAGPQASEAAGGVSKNGLVTLAWLTPGNTLSHFALPGADHGLFHDLNSPQRAKGPPGAPALPPVVVNPDPTNSSDPRGHWVVGHTITKTVAHKAKFPMKKGSWPDVIPSTTSTDDDVTTVQPAWGDGGVKPTFP